ncbi:sigma-54-dependent Fis family transcriptional regulator [Pseudomonas sp. MWU16-30317]|uniref:sigma-54-dependent Fis family transcriptional regulator n=1 Tax=Pseudomonas sp. MWU16-30317 TaxID=2878095 RepID=UPI001CFB8B74|nr:sigma-54-dependent Fis family transcriptional regulator [Pseudomonas sp. MWU16-30317]
MATPGISIAHDTMIKDSWARCREFGLDHRSLPAFGQLPPQQVCQLLERHRVLSLTAHQQVLPFYENILSNANCLILLADNQGQVLNSWGTQRFVEPTQGLGFVAGACWIEQAAGTNAIGTALAGEQAVHIEHDEHFLKANRFMTGSAAPIFDASRRLVGVLDLSSDSFLPPSYTLGMVKMISQTIENRLILDQFQNTHFQLTFNTGLDNLDSQWAGLLIFDESGHILCANRRADSLLGTSLLQASIDELFRTTLAEVLDQSNGQPFALQASRDNRFYGQLKRPKAPVLPLASLPRSGQPVAGALPMAVGFGDAKIEKAFEQAQRLLEKNVPLLILGETGAGKEVFVKALHQASTRAKQPLIAVNCAAIPSELVEAELFGYEKGAFTGAHHKGSIGLIRKAHKATLFLDEIGDMPLAVQARLLRVLQERCVQPLGSSEQHPVDIRLISATHCSLRDQVHRGLFRQDLYYRVSGLNLELPPLRERTDLPALVRSLWNQHREPRQTAGFDSHVMALFERHPWPGNLRQLSNVIQVALALADGELIGTAHLPEDFFADLEVCNHSGVTVKTADSPAVSGSYGNLNELLQACGGNISQLAKHLGVSRNTVYKRLRAQV